MGIVDNIKKRMSANEENEYDNAYDDDGYYSESFGSYEEADDVDTGVSTGMGTGLSGMSSGISLSGSSGSALEMKVVKPQQFDSVSQIADHLLNKRTVVLNLENTSKETARRLIDFLSGVAYSIDGSIKKIATNAYVITPNNVDVGDAQLKAPRQKDPEPEAPAAADVFPEF